MGTLFEQRPRQDTFKTRIWWIQGIAEEMGFKGEKLTPAEWHAVCDVARTALALQNADVLDEQLAGFGEILQELVCAIEGLNPSH
jgi:hypothetical protein